MVVYTGWKRKSNVKQRPNYKPLRHHLRTGWRIVKTDVSRQKGRCQKVSRLTVTLLKLLIYWTKRYVFVFNVGYLLVESLFTMYNFHIQLLPIVSNTFLFSISQCPLYGYKRVVWRVIILLIRKFPYLL